MSSGAKEAERAHVLVVEDSSVFREMQGLLLGQAGYVVSSHEKPLDALEVAAKRHFDLVVIDYELPDMNGQQFMHALRKLQPDIAVVFVSGALTLDLAIQLTSQGVAGIFHKPANPKTLLEKIDETLARSAVKDTAARTGSNNPHARRGTTGGATPFPSAEPSADRVAYTPRYLLGQSERFREFTHRLWKVRDFRAVMLLLGEPGSPFELIARDLAEISLFRDGPVMVCSARHFEPRSLIEVLAPSLLSHDAGTLVVTGVEGLTPAQQKTLENLMTGRDVFLPFARRFRLVLAATHELATRVDDGSFDETLYYKISAISLTTPSLRELRGDIAANAARILAAQREGDRPATPMALSPDAAAWLDGQAWPGNFDQLVRTILGASRHAEGGTITVAALEAGWHNEAHAVAGDAAAFHSVAAPLISEEGHESGETRPPFPIASDLAASKPAAPQTSPAPGTVTTAGSLSFAARAKPTVPPPAVTAKSLFRPASAAYDFSKRLAETLASADASNAR